MSDHIPRSRDEIDRSLLSDFPTPDLSQRYIPDPNLSFFQLDDNWPNSSNQSRPYFEPPSSIHDDQSTYNKLSEMDNPALGRQIGVVSPSKTKSSDNDALIESSRSNILSILSLLNEHVVSHPFMVIRRQAQVNNRSIAYHLTPFTVIPFMLRLQRNQGISTFFKGLPSVLVNYVFLIGSESFFYNLFQFPIEYNIGSIMDLFSIRLLKHLALKSLSILVVTPFICSSAVETVQSWIVGESPYPLEHIKEGFLRVVHFRKDRKLPFFKLIGPSIGYHLCYYILFSLIRQAILQFYYNDNNNHQMKRKTKPMSMIIKDDPIGQMQQLRESQLFDEPYPKHLIQQQQMEASILMKNDENQMMKELKSSFLAHMMADIITYPFQNVLYRLFLQGTRTLIDNVDGRTTVIPLITNYDSVTDCYQTIINDEGVSGLFKGFGALILQYSVQYSILHLTKCCIDLLLNA